MTHIMAANQLAKIWNKEIMSLSPYVYTFLFFGLVFLLDVAMALASCFVAS